MSYKNRRNVPSIHLNKYDLEIFLGEKLFFNESFSSIEVENEVIPKTLSLRIKR